MLKFKLIMSAIFFSGLVFGTSLAYEPFYGVESQETVVLTESNFVTLQGPVTDESVAEVMRALAGLANERGAQKYNLYLLLDTPGGSVYAGYRLYEFIKGYKNIHSITINSYSMGAILSQLMPGNRLILETGTMMFHRMSAGGGGRGTTEQLKSRITNLEQLEKFAEERTASRSKTPIQKLREWLNEELYLYGSDAVRRGFADKLVIVRCNDAVIEKKITKIVQLSPLFPPVEVEISACPLL